MKRCFVALRIDDVARDALSTLGARLAALSRSSARKIRPVKRERFHVTIKFLGATGDAQVPDLLADLAPVAAATRVTRATIVGLGAFPSPARPRIVYGRIAEGAVEITSLCDAVEAACVPLGFEPEPRKKRHPHVTLARVERAQVRGPLTGFIDEHADDPLGAVRLDHLVLFESDLHPTGAVYTPLGELPLGGA